MSFRVSSKTLKELENNPKLILIEKPLCEPNMKDLEVLYQKSKKSNTKILVGYNHIVSKASLKLKDYFKIKYYFFEYLQILKISLI